MSLEEKKNYADKHPSDRKVSQKIINAVKDRGRDGELPCAVAFTIAKDHNVPPAEVGAAADLTQTQINKCQLGLFGYKPEKTIAKPAESVPSPLEEAIRKALVNGRLPCESAWKIAEKLDVTKIGVCSACEALKIKISNCQLGTF
jgi:hypothetical protein